MRRQDFKKRIKMENQWKSRRSFITFFHLVFAICSKVLGGGRDRCSCWKQGAKEEENKKKKKWWKQGGGFEGKNGLRKKMMNSNRGLKKRLKLMTWHTQSAITRNSTIVNHKLL